ncbi:MAG: delta-aminolevulinic acid dehydratase [Acidimicrobiaceae bacterium TMED130]|nr:MAG: delta-aminolevulinic acid dehydratase [Acidimicrobiaceae bacterium TMED130]
MTFPQQRLRRLRKSGAIRRLISETTLSVDDFVAPLFVREGITEPQPIASLPGVFQHTRDSLKGEIDQIRNLGIPSIILFGIPAEKDATGSGAWDPNGIVQQAIADCKSVTGDDLLIMSDLCVDEYTDHGHCGVVNDDGSIDNDLTLDLYKKIAIAQANAGADVIAPSGMMDGQVAAIRQALDGNNYLETPILAYSAKYASGLYGPFREAVNVSLENSDRKSYQQDWRNKREAMNEIKADLNEGADMIMVKPAVTYLDIIAQARELTDVPIGAYHVSGEYSMIKAAGEKGWIDETQVAIEQLTAVKRSGANFILTYFAKEIAGCL